MESRSTICTDFSRIGGGSALLLTVLCVPKFSSPSAKPANAHRLDVSVFSVRIVSIHLGYL